MEFTEQQSEKDVKREQKGETKKRVSEREVNRRVSGLRLTVDMCTGLRNTSVRVSSGRREREGKEGTGEEREVFVLEKRGVESGRQATRHVSF